MTLLNKLFKKSSSFIKVSEDKKPRKKAPGEIEEIIETSKKLEPAKKVTDLKSGGILISPITAEKALSGQSLNQYVFKVVSSANKIEVAKAVAKTYNVKAVSVNIINIPKKAKRVGRTLGFKAGYKKAVITLAKGQSIEIK